MIYKFIFLLLTLHQFEACSPAPGWQPATLLEQINKAGVIVSGKVIGLQNFGFKTRVTLSQTLYYRGCIAGTTVTIAGFHSTASCGPGVPSLGDQIIVFACDDTTGTAILEINDFTLHTGYVQYTNNNINAVKLITGNNGQQCKRSFRIQKCKKRRPKLPFSDTITSKPPRPRNPIFTRYSN